MTAGPGLVNVALQRVPSKTPQGAKDRDEAGHLSPADDRVLRATRPRLCSHLTSRPTDRSHRCSDH